LLIVLSGLAVNTIAGKKIEMRRGFFSPKPQADHRETKENCCNAQEFFPNTLQLNFKIIKKICFERLWVEII